MGRLSNPPEPLETLVGQRIAFTSVVAKRASKRARHSPIGSRSADLNNKGQLSNPVNPSPQDRRATHVPRSTTAKSNRVQKRLRTADIDELVAAYRAGVRVHVLAQRFAVHRTTVMTHLRRRHIPPRPILTVWDHDTLNAAADLYTSGESLASVAARFDVDPSTVANRFRRASVTIRPRRGWISPNSYSSLSNHAPA